MWSLKLLLVFFWSFLLRSGVFGEEYNTVKESYSEGSNQTLQWISQRERADSSGCSKLRGRASESQMLGEVIYGSPVANFMSDYRNQDAICTQTCILFLSPQNKPSKDVLNFLTSYPEDSSTEDELHYLEISAYAASVMDQP